MLGLYPKRTASNAVHFLDNLMLEQLPFPLERIQTDRSAEFFGATLQDPLQRYRIKFRPNRPRSPHVNNEIKRPQQTDRTELCLSTDLADPDIFPKEWQFINN